MTRTPIAVVVGLSLCLSVMAGGKARERASKMGPGMNLSFLENYWQGDKEKH